MMRRAAPPASLEQAAGHTHNRQLPRMSGSLLRVVDTALLAILMVAPLFLGGRHPAGRLVFVVLCVTMAIAWMLRQCLLPDPRVVRCAPAWILAAAVLLVAMQITPLPASVLEIASAQYRTTLPLWQNGGQAPVRLGDWRYPSLTPEATRAGLVILLAYSMLFLVTVQRIGELRDVGRILRWIGLAAVGMAGLGIVQYLVSNGKFLWIYDHPFRNTFAHAQGSFINRNHFAHVLALGIGPMLFWLAVRLSRGGQTVGTVAGLAMALGLLAFAILLSLSRGGAIVATLAALVCVAVYVRASLVSKQMFAGCIGVAVLVSAALIIHGHERVAGRLDDLASGSIEELDQHRGRRDIWKANLNVVMDFPIIGTGVGSHREVHPMYRHDSPAVEFTHAENGYLQVASETGIAGLVLLVSGIVVCGRWCWGAVHRGKSPYLLACTGAVAAGLVASLAHSLIDFVWYIPACMAPTVVLAACALRLDHFSRLEPQASVGRPAWRRESSCAFACLTIAVGAWMIADRLGPAAASRHWDRYLRASVAASQRELEALREAMSVMAPGNAQAPPNAASDAAPEMIGHLEKVVYWHPAHARAHSRLAGLYLDHFARLQRGAANQMDVVQIRDAAVASRFSSRQELNSWLIRAFGKNAGLLTQAHWHARRSIQYCPLQGEAYWYLAQLCFLDGAVPGASRAYLEQALRVRPHEPNVLFAAGKEVALAGDLTAALPYWRKCFHSDVALRIQIIQLFAPQSPAEFFLDSFQPRLADLPSLCRIYRSVPPADGAEPVCDYCVQRAHLESAHLNGVESAGVWLSAGRVCRALRGLDQSLVCLRRACRLDSNNYAVRLGLGELLLELQRYDEAEVHLRWCLRRKPNDRAARASLETALRGSRGRRRAALDGFPAAAEPNVMKSEEGV